MILLITSLFTTLCQAQVTNEPFNGGKTIEIVSDSPNNYLRRLDTIVGLSDYNEPKFKLFPNPSKGTFKINSSIDRSNFKIKISNVNGLVVQQMTVKNNQLVSVQNLTKGVYFVEIVGFGRRRLVIE